MNKKENGLKEVPENVMKKFDVLCKTTHAQTGDEMEEEAKSFIGELGTLKWKEGYYPASNVSFVGFDIDFNDSAFAKDCGARCDEIANALPDFIQTTIGDNPWDKNKLLLTKVFNESSNVIKIMVNSDDLVDFKGMIHSKDYFPFEDSGISPMLPLSLGRLFHIILLYILIDEIDVIQ